MPHLHRCFPAWEGAGSHREHLALGLPLSPVFNTPAQYYGGLYWHRPSQKPLGLGRVSEGQVESPGVPSGTAQVCQLPAVASSSGV